MGDENVYIEEKDVCRVNTQTPLTLTEKIECAQPSTVYVIDAPHS